MQVCTGNEGAGESRRRTRAGRTAAVTGATSPRPGGRAESGSEGCGSEAGGSSQEPVQREAALSGAEPEEETWPLQETWGRAGVGTGHAPASSPGHALVSCPACKGPGLASVCRGGTLVTARRGHCPVTGRSFRVGIESSTVSIVTPPGSGFKSRQWYTGAQVTADSGGGGGSPTLWLVSTVGLPPPPPPYG